MLPNLYLNCEHGSEPTFNKADYLLRAAERLGLSNVLLYKNEQNVDNILNIEPFSNFVKGSNWTGVWEIDLLCDRAEMSPSNWAVCDDVFLAGVHYSGRLNGWNHKITTLFQAIDPTIHRRIKTIPQEYDFVFCGTSGLDLYKERERLLGLLREKYSFMGYAKGVSPSKYIENLNSAKIQFIRSMRSPIADGEIAQRFFECLAIGPVITNYVDDLLHTGLIEGVDYFSYKSDAELTMKMDILVKNDEFRNKMATSGRKKALNQHTYEHRLITIFNSILNKNGYPLS